MAGHRSPEMSVSRTRSLLIGDNYSNFVPKAIYLKSLETGPFDAFRFATEAGAFPKRAVAFWEF